MAAFAEVADEPSSKFGVTRVMLNGDSTSLSADHFDHLVSEDRCHLSWILR